MFDIERMRKEIIKKLAGANQAVLDLRGQLIRVQRTVDLRAKANKRILAKLSETNALEEQVKTVRRELKQVNADHRQLLRQSAGNLGRVAYQLEQVRSCMRAVHEEMEKVVSHVSRLEVWVRKVSRRHGVMQPRRLTARSIASEVRLTRELVALIYATLRKTLDD